MNIYLLLALAALVGFSSANPTDVPVVCKLPRDPGPCLAYMPRWAYLEGRCQEFIYGGCRGNENNFRTRKECEETCIKPQQLEETEISDIQTRQMHPICYEQSGRGNFVFNGLYCVPGAGPFFDFDHCKLSCQGLGKREIDEPISSLSDQAEGYVPPHRDVCERPLYSGPCKASMQRYGKKDGVCQEFIYGGCLNNGNNFKTKEECEEVCIKPQQQPEETEISDIQTRYVDPRCFEFSGPGSYIFVGRNCLQVEPGTGPFRSEAQCWRSCLY